MQKSIVFGVIGLIVGLIVGFFTANSINRNSAQTAAPAAVQTAPAPNPQTPNILVKDQPTTATGTLPDVSATIDKANRETTNFDAQIEAGDLYQKIKGFDKAVVFYERASQIKPDDYALIVKLGNTYFDARQFETAAKWYEQALTKKPNDTSVRTDLGITFVERAAPDYDRAVKEFQTSLQSNPNSEATLYNLGAAYFRQGKIQEAGAVSSQLRQINPNSQLAERLQQLIAPK